MTEYLFKILFSLRPVNTTNFKLLKGALTCLGFNSLLSILSCNTQNCNSLCILAETHTVRVQFKQGKLLQLAFSPTANMVEKKLFISSLSNSLLFQLWICDNHGDSVGSSEYRTSHAGLRLVHEHLATTGHEGEISIHQLVESGWLRLMAVTGKMTDKAPVTWSC